MKQWILSSRPQGAARASDFELVETPIPKIEKNQVLLKTQYLGVAPVMLRYMTNETEFERDLAIGDVMHGRGVGLVMESKNPRFEPGDVVHTKLGWREYAVIDDDPYYLTVPMRQTDLPWSYGAGALGFNGYTAVLGARDIGQIKPGDRVLVSGAAGGVGSHVGFIAKALGASQVIGVAGGPTKCQLLIDRLGYDAAIDYKSEDIPRALAKHFPKGIDVFFDNVGGELLDNALALINRRARIVICGRISEYLIAREDYHRFRNIYRIGFKDAKMEGFFIYDHLDKVADFESTMAQWIREGAVSPLEDIMQGLDTMPAALISLYEGTNSGIRSIQIDPVADTRHLAASS